MVAADTAEDWSRAVDYARKALALELVEALRTARDYVFCELETERQQMKGYERISRIDEIAADLAEIDAALDDAKGGKRSLKISVIENQNHTEHESNVHDEFARLREELNDARDERDAAREESAKLSTEVERLRGIEAAACAYREDGYLGTDGMRHHTPEAYTDFDAALRAAGSGE